MAEEYEPVIREIFGRRVPLPGGGHGDAPLDDSIYSVSTLLDPNTPIEWLPRDPGCPCGDDNEDETLLGLPRVISPHAHVVVEGPPNGPKSDGVAARAVVEPSAIADDVQSPRNSVGSATPAVSGDSGSYTPSTGRDRREGWVWVKAEVRSGETEEEAKNRIALELYEKIMAQTNAARMRPHRD